MAALSTMVGSCSIAPFLSPSAPNDFSALMKTLQTVLSSLAHQSTGKWVLLASFVGLGAGIGAIAFQLLGQQVVRYTLTEFAGYVPAEAAGEHAIFPHPETVFSPWLVVLVMVLGGIASGVVVYTLAPEAEGHGTDAAIDAFHNKRGVIRGRIPVIKTIASAITLGTGGSGGREGPIAQIGAGFGAWLGARLNLSARDRRIMLAAGMGAGVGAIFRAPLAGAVFAAEILYSDADLEADVIVPAATASIVAYSVYTQSLPAETRFMPLFGDLNHTFQSPAELLPYGILAAVLVIAGMAFVKLFYGVHKIFARLPLLPHFRPALGAGLAGLIGIGLYKLLGSNPQLLSVLGTGYGSLQDSLSNAGNVGLGILVLVVVAKAVTTSLTISSGGSGGVFGPSMVMGGCLGAAVGLGLQSLWPALVPQPEAFAVVGMAGFFAGIARAPISTIIMVRAMTGDFALLVPTMLVTTITFVVGHRWRLYAKQVPTRMDSAAHRGDFIYDVLEGLRVRDVFKPLGDMVLIHESTNLDEIVHRLARNHQHYFPVVDDNKAMVGIFTDDDVRSYLYNDEIWKLALASDVMISEYVYVSPDDDLNTALRRFTSLNLDELPVIDPDDSGRLLGMLRRKETIAAYNQRLMEHKQESAEELSTRF